MPENTGIKEIKELYAGVFKVPFDDGYAEAIMCGVYEDGQNMFARSTIEYEPKGLPALIRLCKQIELEKGLSWRLVKFDEDGIHELDRLLCEEYVDWIDTRSLI